MADIPGIDGPPEHILFARTNAAPGWSRIEWARQLLLHGEHQVGQSDQENQGGKNLASAPAEGAGSAEDVADEHPNASDKETLQDSVDSFISAL